MTTEPPNSPSAPPTEDPQSPPRSRVVALGGGHGLAASLRAVRYYADTITGIVSVADDGGSSGILREDLGMPAPGDLRRCLSALAGNESLLGRSLEHRFDRGGLQGHPIGNLLLAGLAEACGDFQAAIDEVSRLIGAVGVVYPATTTAVTLLADSDSGVISGQVTIERARNITNVRFEPPDPCAPPGAVAALLAADQIIIGPGSLFTSVLAVAAVPDLNAAIAASSAQRIFVANVANDKGTARGFDLPEHLDALAAHGVDVDVVVAQTGTARAEEISPELVLADVASDDGWGHNPKHLGAVLRSLISY